MKIETKYWNTGTCLHYTYHIEYIDFYLHRLQYFLEFPKPKKIEITCLISTFSSTHICTYDSANWKIDLKFYS